MDIEVTWAVCLQSLLPSPVGTHVRRLRLLLLYRHVGLCGMLGAMRIIGAMGTSKGGFRAACWLMNQAEGTWVLGFGFRVQGLEFGLRLGD